MRAGAQNVLARVLIAALPGALLACGGAGDAMTLTGRPSGDGPCSPRRWPLDSLAEVVVQPSSAMLEAPARVALAPAFGSEARSSALALPVKFTPTEYFAGIAIAVCTPDARSNLLGQQFSARFFLEGAALPEGAQVNVDVYPRLARTAVPLEMTTAGTWVTYAGAIEPPEPGDSAEPYRMVGELAMVFSYVGTAPWAGTVWVDDVRVDHP